MEITATRRAMLKKWFENRDIPSKEKSYLSQLMTGTASFGERAARRLERDYGMGDRYLDGAGEQADPVDVVQASADSALLAEVKRVVATDEVSLMWATSRDRELFTLFHGTDEAGQNSILRAARAMPRVLRPGIVGNKQ